MTTEPSLRSKLFKNHEEDAFGLHKIIGLCAVASMIYRFSQHGERDCGFDDSIFTPLTIFLHVFLSLSSFVFKLPAKRITSGYRIWPEARLHACIFVLRPASLMLIVWIKAQQGTSHIKHYLTSAAIVLLTNLAADMASRSVGKNRSNTIREVAAPAWVRVFFSIMQFHGSAFCLMGAQRYTTSFAFITIVQCNAFLMTLQRRNIGSHAVMLGIYFLMLVGGFASYCYEGLHEGVFYRVQTVANLAATFRMGFGISKYLIWAGMAATLWALRENELMVNDEEWIPLFGASVLGIAWLFSYKTKQYNDREKATKSQ